MLLCKHDKAAARRMICSMAAALFCLLVTWSRGERGCASVSVCALLQGERGGNFY